MDNHAGVVLLMKGLALLILDIVTMLLVFTVWSLVNIALFPWAFIAIVLALMLVNFAVLALRKAVETYGVAFTVSALAATVLYFLFVMIFTGITYIAISVKWYVIAILLAALFYLAVVAGLYLAGVGKIRDMALQRNEREKALDITVQLASLAQNMRGAGGRVDKTGYEAMIRAFDDMRERLNFSTPFGRIDRAAVIGEENRIAARLTALNGEILSLESGGETRAACERIAEGFAEVKALIMNREKLIVQ